ncbi:hypothetical protein BH10PSE11_BH10PSE11_17700 [soil metagenome]
MKFVNYITYVPDAEKVESVRPAHRDYAHQLRTDGKIVIAGPFADGAGALIVYEAEDRTAAEALAANDPYAKGGVWIKYEIHPWTILGGSFAFLPPQVS